MTTTKKTATFIRTTTTGPASQQRLYRLSPPMRSWAGVPHEYVIASAAFIAYEVRFFPSDEHGEIQSGIELLGSMKNTVRHEDALLLAGYEVQP
ncbi:hypothetical protein AB0E44_09190 [Micrococcus terreus]|uniref:hypothetical protein n=1 Tax=Micrococcus terreus TaxID=574650 RepID=UPI003405A5CA